MCTILAWAGQLPPGLISALLIEAEVRGRDSTGIAYRVENSAEVFRRAVPSTTFVREHQADLRAARVSGLGIAHTRRASPRMPINSANAHPFTYRRIIFAHNGAIRNWKELRAAALTSGELDDYDRDYLQRVQTDSMLLGPAIHEQTFDAVHGSMGVVWLDGPELFCFHSAKELASVTLTWHELDKPDESCAIVASTLPIIQRAIERMHRNRVDVVSKHERADVVEGVLYRVTPAGIQPVRALELNPLNAPDLYTSAVT